MNAWEKITEDTQRMEVPGGWIYLTSRIFQFGAVQMANPKIIGSPPPIQEKVVPVPQMVAVFVPYQEEDDD